MGLIRNVKKITFEDDQICTLHCLFVPNHFKDTFKLYVLWMSAQPVPMSLTSLATLWVWICIHAYSSLNCNKLFFRQVWSNGKFKKVRSRPQPNSLPFSGCDYSCSISLTLLVTLSLDSVITPLLPLAVDCVGDDDDNIVDNNRKRFCDFSLEEYAWRVYHERFPLKDPLLRYRIWHHPNLCFVLWYL